MRSIVSFNAIQQTGNETSIPSPALQRASLQSSLTSLVHHTPQVVLDFLIFFRKREIYIISKYLIHLGTSPTVLFIFAP